MKLAEMAEGFEFYKAENGSDIEVAVKQYLDEEISIVELESRLGITNYCYDMEIYETKEKEYWLVIVMAYGHSYTNKGLVPREVKDFVNSIGNEFSFYHKCGTGRFYETRLNTYLNQENLKEA